jgi:hypothetical protein
MHFLKLSTILEPMQELMARYKTFGIAPRDCLRTALFQKWQRTNPNSHSNINNNINHNAPNSNSGTPSTTAPMQNGMHIIFYNFVGFE